MDIEAIVIDNGSSNTDAGFHTDPLPSCTLPTIVGSPKYVKVLHEEEKSESQFVGNEARDRRGILKMTYPVRNGYVEDWDHMETLWSHVFSNELRIDIEEDELPILLTEPPNNPRRNRERTTETMFEGFSIPAFYMATTTVMSLIASGRTTGLSVECGSERMHAVPIYDGYPIHYAKLYSKIGGRHVTDLLKRGLTEEEFYFATSAEVDIVREIKERVSFVAFNCSQYRHRDTGCRKEYCLHCFDSNRQPEHYELPDGEVVSIGRQRYECTEVLFSPSTVAGKDEVSVQDLVFKSVRAAPIDLRKTILNNVVVSGGVMLTDGMVDRLEAEILESLYVSKLRAKVNVHHTHDVKADEDGEDLYNFRRHSAWVGGSIMAGMMLSDYLEMWITKAEYEEEGSRLIHLKCFQ